MKNLFYLLMLGLLFVSCGKDDDNCSTEDWVGIYSGSLSCNGTVEDVIIEIKEGSGDELILIADDDESTFIPDNCSFNVTEDSGLGVVTVDYQLDGDNLKFTTEGELFGFPVNCSTTLKRQ